MALDQASYRPGEGLKEAHFGWTYDGEIVPEEVWRSIDSAEEELSEETELAFVRFWMEHSPNESSRFDLWYDLWAERQALQAHLKPLQNSKANGKRTEAISLEAQIQAIDRELYWLEEGMAAVLEGEPLPPEPSQPESVKVADLFGTITDTHLTEAQLRNPLASPRRRR